MCAFLLYNLKFAPNASQTTFATLQSNTLQCLFMMSTIAGCKLFIANYSSHSDLFCVQKQMFLHKTGIQIICIMAILTVYEGYGLEKTMLEGLVAGKKKQFRLPWQRQVKDMTHVRNGDSGWQITWGEALVSLKKI